MDFNYFPDLNRYFKTLHYRNQEWFQHRSQLSQEEQRCLFQAFLKMSGPLQEVQKVFLQKVKSTAVSDA
jgi:hypothetical protein